MNLLLVEDEAAVASFLRRGLRSEGWTVSLAGSGETALEMLAGHSFDIVVLDLMLPGLSGQEVCQRTRAKGDVTPILMLTALGDPKDRVAGLRLGADDYLPKPFDFDELIARIEALIRRAGYVEARGTETNLLVVGELTFDTQSLQVTCAGRTIELSAREREMLHLLMSNPGKVFSRELILNSLWNVHEDPLTNVVDVYMSRLRKKLGPHGDMINTVRGAGYRISAKP